MSNLLLDTLAPVDQERFVQDCDAVELEQRQVLVEYDEPIEQVFFPLSGVIAQMAVLSDGNAIESGLIGNDGFVGLSSHFGAEISPMRFQVQVPGEALRISSSKMQVWVLELPRLQTLIARYNDFLLAMAAQGAACNRLHSVTQRCARWFLRVNDRIDGNEFALTQELLAQMLGVRRASVSVAAGELQDAGLIRYVYGRVAVLDEAGLEAVACECVAAARTRYERLFASLMG
jgi:CRP-like cAMP-binding protein